VTSEAVDQTEGDHPETVEWFRHWFGEEYLRLYPHRDQAEAAAAVRLHLEVSGPPRGRSLDLACGEGRHLRELRRAGVDAVGLDLSLPLLRLARRSETQPFLLVRADMRRLPFPDASFSALTSFFTSFGYFAARADDIEAAREIRRVLVPGGRFLLDYLNAAHVREGLVPEEALELDGAAVHVTRSIEGDAVVKRIRITSGQGGPPSEHLERVRLYAPKELETLLASAGLVTTDRFGDYEGAPFTLSSTRLVLAGDAE
jgi:SAM-dependent methyltransferase